MKFLWLGLTLIAGTLSFGSVVPSASADQDRQPLLMPGKKALFQRVITHPGAKLLEQPDVGAKVLRASMTPFTVAYVYSMKADAAGTPQWYEIGAGSRGNSDGWINAADASPWMQSLTLLFSERAGRAPVLFFRDKDSAIKVATSPTHADDVKQLAADFERYRTAANRPADFPIVAREPSDVAVARERFYILPIFGSTDISIGGVPSKILEVASIDPGTGTAAKAEKMIGDPKKYRTAITFVLDTTQSMQPYIDRTRDAIKELSDKLKAAGELGNVSFGIVAFRNSIQRTPGLQYVTKIVSNLQDGTDPNKLLALTKDLKATDVSSHSFDEDALAGLKTAITDLDWDNYGARIIFLVTDAGAIRKEDPAGQTHMNETELALLAADKQIKIFAFHLRSPAGARAHDHERAEAQYRRLTQQSDATLGDLYIPIPNADASVFKQKIDVVAGTLTNVIHATAAGKRVAPPPDADAIGDSAARKAAAIGYAMQLDFLGRKQAAAAPEVVRSFVSERDLTHAATASLEVGVLLTRQQLSDLHDGLTTLLGEAQRAKRLGSGDFFERLASTAAQISRDPQQQNRKDLRNLSEVGLFGEYLSDLPYKSPVLLLTEDQWAGMSIGEQQEFIDSLESKLNLYVEYDKHSDSWESFGAHNPNDAVFRVPMSALP